MKYRPLLLPLAALIWLCRAGLLAQGQGFLADQLPLELEVTTPSQLITSNNSVTVQRRQAITAVFTRPVIALGSDFGDSDNYGDKVPFRLSCNVPGRFRWVTTYIARFDTDVDWPTDLDCTLNWNADLTTYDGVPFTLPARPSVPLKTKPLTMSITGVTSELATNLTDNNWYAFTGLKDDILPEVPPDGKIKLYFSYPVNLASLQSGLQAGAVGDKINKVRKAELLKFSVERCDMTPAVYPLDVVMPSRPSSGVMIPDYLNTTDTCAIVRILDDLEVGKQYKLVFPKGSTYNLLSGSLKASLNVTFGGLRYFRFPLLQTFQQEPRDSIYNGVSYTRLNLWLVHGLSRNTSLSSLASAISICVVSDISNICSRVPFQANLTNNGTLQLLVPTLTSGMKYRVSVAANARVVDGFGLPLLSSNNSWLTNDLQPLFQGPAVLYPNSDDISLLPAGSAVTWPYIVRGKGNTQEAGYWRIDVSSTSEVIKVLKLLANSYDVAIPNSDMGPPDGFVAADGSSNAKMKMLEMSGAPQSLYLVYTCCSPSYYPKARNVTSSLKLVGASNMSAALIRGSGDLVTWVTGVSQDGALLPLSGAKVTLFRSYYQNGANQFSSLGSCTTAADGTCSLPQPTVKSYESAQISVLAVAADNQAVLLPNVDYISTPSPQNWVGKLILDRQLVKPGDSLHVTGYVQQVVNAELKIPNVTSLTLQISPNFNPQNYTPISIVAKYDPTVGSIHAVIPIPDNATSSDFSLSLKVPGNSWENTVSSASFTVSDPRPPTAALTVNGPKWAKTNASIPIQVVAVSYLGADVGNAKMTVRWTAGSNAQGVQYVVTNSEGVGNTSIELGALPKDNATVAGDSLNVDVEWIGPTRERITQSISVSLQDAARTLLLSYSPSTLIPSVPFFSQASVTDADTGDVKGVDVLVTLVANDTSCPDAVLPSCTLKSGAPYDPTGCSLALPCTGKFFLKACTTDDSSVCSNVTVGQTADDWASDPWSSQPDSALWLMSQGDLHIGDTAMLGFYNPWEGVTAFVRWGNGLTYKQTLLQQLPSPGATFNLTLGEECKGGCGVVVVLGVSADAYGATPPNVTTSKLFNPQAPFYITSLSTTINIPEQAPLNVTLDLGSATVLAPGQNVTWTVTVTEDEQLAPDVEVTVVAVDKAILDLMPYPLQDPSESIKVLMNLYQAVNQKGTAIDLAAIQVAFATAMRRLGIDPWVSPQTYVTPGYGSQSVDQSDEEFFKQYFTAITLTAGNGGYPPIWGNGFGPRFQTDDVMMDMGRPPAMFNRLAAMPMPVAAPLPETMPMAKSGLVAMPSLEADAVGGGAGNAASASLRVEGDFTTTPLFTWFKTKSDGAGQVNFTAPQNLGSFVVRAYAASPSGRYGQAEDSVIVRRTVSLTASLPRFVRVGDTFEGGVIVTLSSSSNDVASVEVQVAIVDTMKNSPVQPVAVNDVAYTQSVQLGGAGGQSQAEVRFNFSATALGTAKIMFTASDGQGAGDAVELELPVEMQQGRVVVATSSVLYDPSTTNSSAAWQEGLDLPLAWPGSGSLDLKMGVGYLPAILGISDTLTSASSDDPYAPLSLSRTTLGPVLALYKVTPQNNSLIGDSAVELSDLTFDKFGLQYSDPTKWGWPVNSCPIILNAQASYFAAAYTVQRGSLLASTWTLVKQLSNTWKNALANQLVLDAVQSRKEPNPQAYSDFNTLAWARLALGSSWEPPLCTQGASLGSGFPACANAQISQDLSMKRLIDAVDQQDLETQLVTSLVLGATIPSVTTTILSGLRVQGQTAYLAAGDGEAAPASLLEQSLALLVLTQARTKNQLVPKLAAYVAAGQVATSFVTYHVYTDYITQAFRMKALSAYDTSTSSTTPDLLVGAYVGNTTLTSTLFNSSSQLVLTSTKWEDLPSPPPPLEFTANGTGQVSVAASLNFVPATLLPYPTYRGVWVEAVVRQQDPLTTLPTGPSLQQVPLKSVVVVTVQVTTPDALGEAVLEVWLPGGLEALDPNVAPGVSQVCSLGDALGGYRPYGWWWPVCPAQDTRTDKVIFRWQYLAAGTSSVQFMAVAATPGNFVMPPITAYAAQQPEVMGMTAGYYFVICDSSVDPTCTPLAAAAQPPAKACPGDCNGNGVCDITVGTCNCDGGYSGDSCDTFSAYASS